jgi:phosphatidylglycerophosphatase A
MPSPFCSICRLALVARCSLLFRALDIVKPWPIREIDHSLRGGLGTMLDDAVAGLFTGLALSLARFVLLDR